MLYILHLYYEESHYFNDPQLWNSIKNNWTKICILTKWWKECWEKTLILSWNDVLGPKLNASICTFFKKLYLHNVLKNKEIFFPFSQYCNYVFHFLIFYSAQWGVHMHRRRRHDEGGVWVFKIPKSKEEKCGWIGLCLLLTYNTYLTQIIQQILTFTTYNYNLVINFQLLQNYLDLAIYF